MTKKVFISAGHGGSDPGACANGLKEKDINLTIALACKDELVRHGVKVVMSRTTDVDDPVQEEVKEANKSGCDVAISFHTNAGGGNGSESFYWMFNANGKRLALLCEKHVKELGQNSRGIKTNNLMFTRETKMTAVLCECAFIDNAEDVKIINTKEKQKKFGVAYAKAILEYLGIKYIKEVKQVSKKKDYEGHWSENAIKEVVKKDIMSFNNDGNFRPDDKVTRAELASVIARVIKLFEKK